MTVLLVLVRTLHLGSAMMLVALPFFLLVILGPLCAADNAGKYASFWAGAVRWLWPTLIVQALSGLGWFWLVTAQMSDQSPWQLLAVSDLNAVLGQTQFGRLWLGRLGIGFGLAAAVLFLSRSKSAPRSRRLMAAWTVLAGGGLLLVTLAWAGHAGAGTHYRTLHLLADALHLVTGSIWPLGLVPMGCLLFHIDQDPREPPTDEEVNAVRRFSRVSFWAVLVLVSTGVINGWLMVGSWGPLATTVYGRLLLLKIGIVAVMIGLGGFNRLSLLPQLQAHPSSYRMLRKTVWSETGLAFAVLVIVGIMGMTSPPS